MPALTKRELDVLRKLRKGDLIMVGENNNLELQLIKNEHFFNGNGKDAYATFGAITILFSHGYIHTTKGDLVCNEGNIEGDLDSTLSITLKGLWHLWLHENVEKPWLY
jgi:hypothetical protein